MEISVIFRTLAIFACILLSNGCSLFAEKVALDHITVDVDPRANNDTPIAIDFVATADSVLEERLKGTTAAQWFEQRDQLQKDYPGQLNIWSLELVPGQFMALNDIPLKGQRSHGLLVFASYNTPGAHRLVLQKQSSIWLKLEGKGMRLLDSEGQ
ncbi:type VI secretion protein [Pseudomonas sp. JZ134]|uniref:type VI secretion protein n=1 Tax=Pseudomonas sp. JZ134 TaxID=2806615 RepID=UPI003DA0556E